MLVHVIKTSLTLNPKKIFIIVGKFRNIITETINKFILSGLIINSELIKYIDQEDALGTGDAIKCTLPHILNYKDDTALILSGDVPLISFDILNNMIGNNNKLLITELEDPNGCGRIILDNNNNIIDIFEEKDCTQLEKKIKLVNCGIYQIFVKDKFSSYEIFWKEFIVPLTGRPNNLYIKTEIKRSWNCLRLSLLYVDVILYL
jgi:bifunctional N-acetylglucosamine-1-phosphate-uridyltransferase/glucosamine-1-phosphate-acetyltransferase GlmU-like protein